MRYYAGFGCEQSLAYCGHEWSQDVDVVAWRNNYDNRNLKISEVLLIFQIAVNRQDDIKLRCRKLQ